jgi:hypothetical protein
MAKLDVRRMIGIDGTEFARLHNELEKDLCEIFGIIAGQNVELPIFGAVNADGSIDSMRFTQSSQSDVDNSIGIEFYDNRRRCRLSFAGGRFRTFSKVSGEWVLLFDIEDAPEPALTDKIDVQSTVVKTAATAGQIIGVTSTQPWKFRLYPGTYLSSGADSMPDLTDVDDQIKYFVNYCLGVGGTVDEPVLVMFPLPVDRAMWALISNVNLFVDSTNIIVTDWLENFRDQWVGSGVSINDSYFLDPNPFTQSKRDAFIRLGKGCFKIKFNATVTAITKWGGGLYLNVNSYAMSPGTVVNPPFRHLYRGATGPFYVGDPTGRYNLIGPEYHVINRQYDSEFYISVLSTAKYGQVINLAMEITRMN